MTDDPPRLKSGLWVRALIRRCEVAGAFALLLRKGAEEAGDIALKLTRGDGLGAVLVRASKGDGQRVWLRATGPEFVSQEACTALLERRAARDPDLWILEIEDREGRAFVDDPIE